MGWLIAEYSCALIVGGVVVYICPPRVIICMMESRSRAFSLPCLPRWCEQAPPSATHVPVSELRHRNSPTHPAHLASGRYFGNTLGHFVKIKTTTTSSRTTPATTATTATTSPSPTTSPTAAAAAGGSSATSASSAHTVVVVVGGGGGRTTTTTSSSDSRRSPVRQSTTLKSVFRASVDKVELNASFSPSSISSVVQRTTR
jgi:hypothetical protein